MNRSRSFTFMASCLVTVAACAALPACSSNSGNETPTDSGTDSSLEAATPDTTPEAATPDSTPDADKDVATPPTECDAAAPLLTDYDGGLSACIADLRANKPSELAACQQSCGCAAFVLGCLEWAPPPQTVGAINCLSAAPTAAINGIFIAAAHNQQCAYPDAGPPHDAAADVEAPDAHDAAAE